MSGVAFAVETMRVSARSWAIALSASDAAQYRAIFTAERAGQFDKADRLMAQVSDPSLKGYVLAEQYLSSRGKAVRAEPIGGPIATAGGLVFITVDGPWDVNWVEGPPTDADLTK